MKEKNPFVVAVLEGGVVQNVYAFDGTEIDYGMIDHDEIATADFETLVGIFETLQHILRIELAFGQDVTRQETIGLFFSAARNPQAN